MTAVQRDRRFYALIFLLCLILASNVMLYRSPVTPLVLPADAHWVVIGSLIDLAIVAPLLILFLRRGKKITVKSVITLMVTGIVFARFLIPSMYFEPFSYIPIAAIGLGSIHCHGRAGINRIIVVASPRHHQMDQISGGKPAVFIAFCCRKTSLSTRSFKGFCSRIDHVLLCARFLKKKPPTGEAYFSLHQKSSFIAFYIMLIHAIIIETAAVHWLIHEMSVLVSVIMLLLNIYKVLFFVGDIQGRLNPLLIREKKIYVSLGLGKRMVIPMEDIAGIKWGKEANQEKLNSKETISFIARDFESLPQHCT